MQRIVDFGLDVHGYVDVVREKGIGALKVPGWALECPWCQDRHRLNLHGSYGRYATSKEAADWTDVRRALCKPTGQTVSFLPQCLAPKKQHSFEVIGVYYEGRLVGLSQQAAMEQATRVNPSRQKGACWERCLSRGRARGEVYLGSGRREPGRGSLDGSYIRRLREGFKSLGQALAVHNRRIRERLGVWLL
jgi:hypothetical protein